MNTVTPSPAKEAFPISGGCTCGQLRYALDSRPLFVHCCHCRWCQRESGGAFAINAMIESSRVRVTRGKTGRATLPSNSGKGQIVVRCPQCCITVWSHYAGAGERISFVRVGSLDQPDALPPDIHIFTASKQAWVILPEDTPAVEEYYRSSRYWPDESLRRYAALKQAME